LGGKFHRIQVFYFWTNESGGLYPGCLIVRQDMDLDADTRIND